MSFDPGRFPIPVRDDLLAALRKSWSEIGQPGTWWTGAERVAIAAVARAERRQRAKPPWTRDRSRDPVVVLPEKAIEAARRIAADAHTLDREWAEGVIDEIGDAHYVEIATVVVTVSAADAFCEAMGIDHEPLPDAQSGEPSKIRPEGLGDIGSWVPSLVEFSGFNVARAMSLVPAGVRTFFRLASAMYSGADFDKMVWDHRPLGRPQVELLAARVSAMNECFY